LPLGANVLGYFDLARVIATGTLYSAYTLFAVLGAAQVLSVNPVVFLVDVDNTLLDNDRITADLMRHLEREVGYQSQERQM
jgi:hypothetical protein